MAFMLPVATPPNAIVFASGKVTIRQMAREGLWLNLLALVAISGLAYWLMVAFFGITLGELPDWAAPAANG
ncbi:anion permease [Paracoccus sp. SSJ]|uniref:anion permease n=1 Tax=Paracoccus sp. SSJ TaxID=3050636 RepID=UPI00254EAAD7|nr:anion permease [Paracoccus sp. SSJ]MDK8875099.1 anion permease [Paracoccus sp. SSJ]